MRKILIVDVKLAVCQPGYAVGSAVDGAHSIAENLREQPFAEGISQAGVGS